MPDLLVYWRTCPNGCGPLFVRTERAALPERDLALAIVDRVQVS